MTEDEPVVVTKENYERLLALATGDLAEIKAAVRERTGYFRTANGREYAKVLRRIAEAWIANIEKLYKRLVDKTEGAEKNG